MAKAWRARVVDARRAADDPAEPAVPHLLLGAQEAFLVAAAVADPQIAVGALQGVEDRLGVVERKADRLLHQHRLAELERRQIGVGVLLLRRRDDHRGDVGMGDHLLVAAGMHIRAGLLGQRAGARRVLVGNGEEAHRRVLGGEPRPQRADAAGADHRDAEIGVFHAASFPPHASLRAKRSNPPRREIASACCARLAMTRLNRTSAPRP